MQQLKAIGNSRAPVAFGKGPSPNGSGDGFRVRCRCGASLMPRAWVIKRHQKECRG